MKLFSADYLRKFATDFFTACGSPPAEARLVADNLVESNLMGYDSHGVMRCIEYLRCVKDGRVKPGAPVKIIKESPSTAVVDCGLNFGPVSMNVMVDVGCEKAKTMWNHLRFEQEQLSTSAGLGSYVQKVAERGMFGFLSCNMRQKVHVVVPLGGRDGRLGTNPLAFAAPTKGWPVVLDMSTCMIAAGKIDMALFEDKQLPEGCIQDEDGNPTTDPKDFYGPKGELLGTMLTLGSPRFGYKGYGLSMMTEILGGMLGGEDATRRPQSLQWRVADRDQSGSFLRRRSLPRSGGSFLPVSDVVETGQGLSGGGRAGHLRLPLARETPGGRNPGRRPHLGANRRGGGGNGSPTMRNTKPDYAYTPNEGCLVRGEKVASSARSL